MLALNPSRSWNTSTWPSQAGPAPMPMVGTSSGSVTAAPTFSGTPSTTTAKHAGADQGLGALDQAPAASSSRAWTLKPPKACTDWGVSPMWPITGISASTSASHHGRPDPARPRA